MAAYAALVSLMQTIHQIKNHPNPPISLDKEQVESLTENVIVLQEFLEAYPYIGNNEEGIRLESAIAAASYMAEDIIESHIVDQIFDGNYGESIVSIDLYRSLEKAIEDMDLIKIEAMGIKRKMGEKRKSYSIKSSFILKNIDMVGFDDILLKVLDKLTGGGHGRQIIPIVGMGGIGKTTLARNIYVHPLVSEYFYICAWVTISQEYDARKILKEVLLEANRGYRDSSEKDENEIGEALYKCLFGRRYLIIMDDMWNIDAWDKVKMFFPDNKNGSRIVVTTRLSNLASQLTNTCALDIEFLDEDRSWDLFSKIVFACPPELEEIGKEIVRSCKGLPLSIVVIGGILAKAGFRREYWEYIEENFSSTLISDNNKQCLRILEMSYNQLPVHLKPCFLYMGIYDEDHYIRVSTLVKLWVAEGFLKPIGGKSLEEVAEEYLKDLVDRNLVLVHELGSLRNMKYVEIHDLLRDMCLRQAQKERFYNVVKRRPLSMAQDAHSQRRLIISDSRLNDSFYDALLSMPLLRSLICNFEEVVLPSPPHHRLVRIFEASSNSKVVSYDHHFLEKLVNLRHIFMSNIFRNLEYAFPLHSLWNLQIFTIMDCGGARMPSEFWNLHFLRHVYVMPSLGLPNPLEDGIVLENLQTLTKVNNFKCGEELVRRIPNVKKFKVSSDVDLSFLDRLGKLESFNCELRKSVNLTFPSSLKKLTLSAKGDFYWEEMLEKIGLLPLLQKLTLREGSFESSTWETVEGQFPNLRVLELDGCDGLECWEMESSHFPRLENLVLYNLEELNEIPSDIGEILTLKSMKLGFCSNPAVNSTKRILEEQEELYGEKDVTLRVQVELSSEDYEALQELASPSFKMNLHTL